ncbi:DUF5723 family protein [Mucilaginibacter auburnensis]|uniref:DUF5723 domain-containing protein n=1 Tax=Mucilaginibacter auburnensis TaxID=1457233 RepID=A0A2H9VTN3_9SPHI|nr:DUF5723 family protein [Mucilaginibacter auburnensis]PJJ84159.1 hypothetical protein CLV57_1168 [Mucilaginibacter auburnensis]
MKKVVLVSCFLLLTVKLFAQQFSQYNTGTLYDSFENPSQRSFIPDSSRFIASNFFIPNLTGNFYVTGNAQDAVIDRFFSGYYNTKALQIGQGKYSNIRSSSNAYLAMLKIFTSLNGNQEIGFSISSRAEAMGYVTDESLALFAGPNDFNKSFYANVLNDNYSYQVYHQFSFSYREQINPRFALGIKLSALLGLAYSDVRINQSQLTLDQPNDAAIIALSGTGKISEQIKKFTFKNPGAAITIGTGLTTRDGYRLQFNLKDLGIIRWGGDSYIANFVSGDTINNFSKKEREQNIINAVSSITSGNKTPGPFYSHTNAIFETSINRTYWLDYDKKFRIAPTLIASKELFYDHVTAAAVVPFSYNNITVTGTASYNTLGLFNWGGQLMYKTPNFELFAGTERLYQSAKAVRTALRNNGAQQEQVVRNTGAYSGADVFFGISFKFGNVIEHPMNASWIPNGEDGGFFSRIWHKVFKGKQGTY